MFSNLGVFAAVNPVDFGRRESRWRPVEDKPAGAQAENAVGEPERQFHLVQVAQQGQTAIPAQAAQQVEHEVGVLRV